MSGAGDFMEGVVVMRFNASLRAVCVFASCLGALACRARRISADDEILQPVVTVTRGAAARSGVKSGVRDGSGESRKSRLAAARLKLELTVPKSVSSNATDSRTAQVSTTSPARPAEEKPDQGVQSGRGQAQRAKHSVATPDQKLLRASAVEEKARSTETDPFPNPGFGVGTEGAAGPSHSQPPAAGRKKSPRGRRALQPETLLKPDDDAGTSPRRLAPGVGEFYISPPPVPPVPRGFEALESEDQRVAERPSLTLATFEQMAQANNPTLHQAQNQIEGALGQAMQAGLWPNPMVMYKGLLIGDPGAGAAGTPTAGIFQGGVASQTIITAGKRRLDREKLLEMTKAAQWKAVTQEWEILNSVRSEF